MSFKNPREWEKKARFICDGLGITEISAPKFRRLSIELNKIQSKGADAAYARLGRGVVETLEHIESILATIKRREG